MATFELNPIRPFSSFISGMGAEQQMEYSGLRNQAIRGAAEQQKEEKAALKAYAAGGGDRDLLAASPDLWMRLNKSQREDVENAMKEFREQAPFLTPENYPKWREGFQSKYKGFNQALFPPPDQMQTPEQVKGFVTKAAALATDLETQKHKSLLAEQTRAKQEEWKTIGQPHAQMEISAREKLAGIQYDKQLTLQQNQQKFQEAENKKKLDLEREIKDARTTEQREQHFMTNFRSSQVHLNDAYMKQMTELDKQGLSGVERDAQELRIRRSYDDMQNELVKTYKPMADKYKIPFPYEVKEMKSTTGSAGGPVSPADALAELKRRGVIK